MLRLNDETIFGLYREGANRKNLIATYERAISARDVVLVPEDGWQGSNEGKRNDHKHKVCLDDHIYQNLLTRKLKAEKHLRLIQAELDAQRLINETNQVS